MKEKKDKQKKSRTLLTLMLKYSWILLLGILMTFVQTKVIVDGTQIIADAIDKLLAGQDIALKASMFKLSIMIAIGTVTAFLESWFIGKFSVNVQKQFKHLAIDKISNLEMRYFGSTNTGGVITKLVSDISQTNRLLSDVLPEFFVMVVTAITILVTIWQMSIWVVVTILVCFPLMFLISNKIAKKIEDLEKIRRTKLDTIASIATDSIQGIIVGKTYNLYEIIKAKIDKAIEAIVLNEYKRVKASTLSWNIQRIFQWIPRIICTIVVLFETLNGTITIGGLTSFVILLGRLLNPISWLAFVVNDLREIKVSVKRLEELMDETAEPTGTNSLSYDEANGAVISWNNIFFSYNDESSILNNISFDIQKGQTVAFVGSSGGGKTTIFRLLCGFYRANKGTYNLYGINFNDWQLNKAREQISLVSQNVFLFPNTIEYNVAIGKVGATRDEVIEVCKRANIHEFIIKLEKGYDTIVGERGTKLSGGEIQRISIARAFLKNAPILILDEPTSSIDIGTERLIQEAIDNVSNGKTVIIVAHRLSTVHNADKIFVVKNGTIIQSGKHDELLELDGEYKNLYGFEQECVEYANA